MRLIYLLHSSYTNLCIHTWYIGGSCRICRFSKTYIWVSAISLMLGVSSKEGNTLFPAPVNEVPCLARYLGKSFMLTSICIHVWCYGLFCLIPLRFISPPHLSVIGERVKLPRLLPGNVTENSVSNIGSQLPSNLPFWNAWRVGAEFFLFSFLFLFLSFSYSDHGSDGEVIVFPSSTYLENFRLAN